MDKRKLIITGENLTLQESREVAEGRSSVEVAPLSRKKVEESRLKMEERMGGETPIYGFNMGFGQHQNVRVSPENLAKLQVNLIRTHAISFGDSAPIPVVRAAMLFRANALAKGLSGVRWEVVETLVQWINNPNLCPWVPKIGSLGASGDLSPLSHIAMNLLGEGRCWHREDGSWVLVDAAGALEKEGVKPLVLEAKDGLALNNGMQFTTAYLAYLIDRVETAVTLSLALGAALSEVMLATDLPFIPDVQRARPYPGQEKAARLLVACFQGSGIRESHRSPELDPNTQDPYSSRCLPQVYGPCLDAITYARRQMEVEINSATDNPLVFGDKVVSGGNFHGMPVALTAAHLFNAFCGVVKMGEARVRRVVDKEKNRLGVSCLISPEADRQVSSGMMILEYSYHALCNLILSWNSPAFLFSASSASGQEDHVSHAPTVVLNLERALDHFSYLLALETFMTLQGYAVLEKLETPWRESGRIPQEGKLTPGRMGKLLQRLSKSCFRPLDQDRHMQDEVERLREELFLSDRLALELKDWDL
ncbi:MAG TPA: aromatic amino acid ammonia-lyase [Candidatus Aminicenantes bacterium]|nr:aromatic amino acid ammonia-lyase [Candidatus Aminicenantes bacterium]